LSYLARPRRRMPTHCFTSVINKAKETGTNSQSFVLGSIWREIYMERERERERERKREREKERERERAL
jgi:hypothetical protein